MLDVKLYKNDVKPTWCPGCGDFGILNAVKQALAELEILPHQVLFVSGIGCGSKLPDYIRANGFCTIHGRPLPVAQGVKLANHSLHVVVVAGDGDSYGIGGNHFLHACRRNPDITHIVENNMVYGLTKGQYSPTSERGFVSSTSPDGALEQAVNPIALALVSGATFVARGFSGDPKHLAQLIVQGIRHRGYALIDVLQPCVIFNRVNTYEYYRDRVYRLEETDHDPADFDGALARAREWGDRIPIGLFYRREDVPTYEEQVAALAAGPLVEQAPRPLTVEEREALVAEFL